MAQETKDRDREVDEDTLEGSSDAEDTGDVPPEHSREALTEAEAGASDDGDEDGLTAPANLGADRYVLAGFFAAGMMGAYVAGRAIQSLWAAASNKDWFAQRLPALAAVNDEGKSVYAMILGGIVAAIFVYRTYKRPDVRAWADDVASELAKVVWPSRKDVVNSTFIVIAAGTVATLYLMLLDWLWALITNRVYGDGS